MRTAEEQYQKQFNEIRQRWKRGRRRRALGMLITGVIGAIAALISHFFFNAAKYEPWNYIVVLCGIALVIATPITIFRIFIRPIREEEAEIAHLNRVYEEQRFINRE
jgi:cation transport ATPase